jgi:hypothetical protein
MQGGQYDESDGNYKTWGDTGLVLMIGGAAALATGGILYWIGRDGPSGDSHSTVSVGYLPGRGGGIQIGGQFP